MARKASVLLKSTTLPPSKLDAHFIAKMRKFVPVEGFENNYNRYVAATEATAAQWSKVNAIAKRVDAKGPLHPEWRAFEDACAQLERLQRQELATWDAYRHAVKHRFDKIGVAENELRAIVNDSLSGTVEDVQFNLNVGLLASKVAQAIRELTIEESVGTPPMCAECGEE